MMLVSAIPLRLTPIASATLRAMFAWLRRKAPVHWTQIHGWFQWRLGQEEAVRHFEAGSRFVEVGNFLGRSLCSLGELVQHVPARPQLTILRCSAPANVPPRLTAAA
jgi:hypothetical protein